MAVLKNMKQRLLMTGFLMMLSASAGAEPEPWYTYWALGFSHHTYESDVQSFVDEAQGMSGTFDRAEGSDDTFGFYWPTDKNTLLGFVISSNSDIITEVETDSPNSLGEMFSEFPYFSGVSDYVTIRQTLYGASAMHFYGDEAGDGFFVRADAGIAQLKVESKIDAPISSATGYGLLGGIGYGWPVSEESRLLLGISYAVNEIGGRSYQTTLFNIGGLW